MTSRTTSWAIWSQLSAAGWWCRRRAARPAMTTATEAGRSARSGAPATADTWHAAAKLQIRDISATAGTQLQADATGPAIRWRSKSHLLQSD
jgi:hypothetical protein